MIYRKVVCVICTICATTSIACGQTIVESTPSQLVTFSTEYPELTKLAPALQLAVLSNGTFVGYGVTGQPLIQFDASRSLQDIRQAIEEDAGGRITAPFRKSIRELFSRLPHGTQIEGPLNGISKINQLIVVTELVLQDRAKLAGQRIISRSASGEFVTVENDSGFSAMEILRLVRSDGTLYVEPNIQLELFDTAKPNDPLYLEGKQWGVSAARFTSAWSSGTTNSGAIVAVIDTGIFYAHKDLSGNIWSKSEHPGRDVRGDRVFGFDFRDDDYNPTAEAGESHGTQVAGIISAIGNNGLGMAGAIWNGKIMSIRAFSMGGADLDDVADAIDYAVDNGANIVNASWGTRNGQEAIRLRRAIQRAESAGVLIVAAAGNRLNDVDLEIPVYPVSYPNTNIIGVAASGPDDKLWKDNPTHGSNTGAKSVDLVAPGSGILSLLPADEYDDVDDGNDDGTSFAAPYVSAAAALLWAKIESESPELRNVEVMRKVRDTILNNTGKRVAFDGRVLTGGQLDLGFLSSTNGSKQAKLIDPEATISGELVMHRLHIGASGTGVVLMTDDDGPVQLDISRNQSLFEYLHNLDGDTITLEGILYEEPQVPVGSVKVLIPEG